MTIPSLLPPNASPLERLVEQLMARVEGLAVPLRDLWNPDTCPIDLLPWLAWTVSIDNWSPSWSEAVRRQRTRIAIEIQRHKGTAKSVRDVVASFGGAVALREWHQQTPPGDPHTFNMVLGITGTAGEPATAGFVDAVIAEVERTKPVRSHYTFTLGLQGASRIGLRSIGRVCLIRRFTGTAS